MAFVTALCLMFIFTASNHMGLVKAIEDVAGRTLPIVNCPRCGTFWSVMLYMLFSHHGIIMAVASALLFAYAAIWFELAMAMVEKQYNRIYDEIILHSASDKITSDAETGDTADSMS